MNLDDLKDKFDRAGGKEILGQYAREHVLGFALLQTALQGTSQKSLEIVRLSRKNPQSGPGISGSCGWMEWRMRRRLCRDAAGP